MVIDELQSRGNVKPVTIKSRLPLQYMSTQQFAAAAATNSALFLHQNKANSLSDLNRSHEKNCQVMKKFLQPPSQQNEQSNRKWSGAFDDMPLKKQNTMMESGMPKLSPTTANGGFAMTMTVVNSSSTTGKNNNGNK